MRRENARGCACGACVVSRGETRGIPTLCGSLKIGSMSLAVSLSPQSPTDRTQEVAVRARLAPFADRNPACFAGHDDFDRPYVSIQTVAADAGGAGIGVGWW